MNDWSWLDLIFLLNLKYISRLRLLSPVEGWHQPPGEKYSDIDLFKFLDFIKGVLECSVTSICCVSICVCNFVMHRADDVSRFFFLTDRSMQRLNFLDIGGYAFIFCSAMRIKQLFRDKSVFSVFSSVRCFRCQFLSLCICYRDRSRMCSA